MISFMIMIKEKINSLKPNTATVVTGLLILLCFIPLLSDVVKGREYYEYREASMIDARLNEVAAIPYTIGAEDELKQTFDCTYDKLKWIALAVPSDDDKTGNAHVKLLNTDTGHILGEWDIAASMADENGWVYLNIDPAEGTDMRGMECELVITSAQGSEEKPCAIGAAGKNYYDKGSLTFNEAGQDDDLFLIVRGYSDKAYFKLVRTWLCIYMALLVYIICFLTGRRKLAKT